MKGLKKSNKEIKEMGGKFLRLCTDFDNHYGGWITNEVYLLNGEEVFSLTEWEFQNP
jgi:hypothetical protein